MSAKRSYTKRKRAEQQEETRLRIVEAAVRLHQEVGGLQTTISAIAEHAGVERATVYRYFPDERSLLQACTGHYLSQNHPPDPSPWCEIIDPVVRLTTGLTTIYAYHRATEVMSARAAIDIPQIPTLQEVLAPMFEYWRGVTAILAEPWDVEAPVARVVTAAVGHAVSFTTWQSLIRQQQLSDDEAVEVMVGMVGCSAGVQRQKGVTDSNRM
jgi:AcrR family transcriptional regulator